MKTILGLMLAIFSITIFANQANGSIKFYLSNNQGEISPQIAYTRLVSIPQQQLIDTTIHVLQINHIEQGKFEDVLGTYLMSNDKKLTADNSEIFFSSPYQTLQKMLVFKIAKQLANTLSQDSVAVFIPSQSHQEIGDIQVYFNNHKPTIKEIINQVHSKLPASYSEAFTIHLNQECPNFENNKVNSIEWLGNKNVNTVKAVFPHALIISNKGKAYLIFRNGKTSSL